MGNDNTSGGADAGKGSANPENQNQDSNDKQKNTDVDNEKKVSWKDHKRAIDDLHKYKNKAADFEKRLNDLETQKLEENENWKGLAERSKADAEKWKTQAEENKSLFVNTQKFSAVRKFAAEAGLKSEAYDDLDLLDLNNVVVETTDSGRYVVHGAKDFVAELKQKRPHWFQSKTPPNVNSGGGNDVPPGNKEYTSADVIEAERQYKIGKISREQYHKIYTAYCSQRK